MKILRLATLAALAAAAVIAPASANAATIQNIGIAAQHTMSAGVLDVAGGSAAAGAKVIQYPVNGNANQRWSVVESPGGSHVVNQLSGLCLTTNGTPGTQLYVTYCNDSNPRQDWEFDAPEFHFSPDGGVPVGPIINRQTGLVVDVKGASGLAGTPIIGWYSTGTNNQYFAYWHWN